MSESQNNNQDPNNADEEQSRTAGSSSVPQDVSGSFKLAQNPEQFFQGSVPLDENDVAMQTRSFSFSSNQFNPDPLAAATFNPNVLPGSAVFNPEPSAVFNPEPSAVFNPEPSAVYNSEPSASSDPPAATINSEPSASYNTAPSGAFNPDPSALINPGIASHPDSSGAFNPDPAADFQRQDFFDSMGRQSQTPQSFATQPQVFNQPEPSGAEPTPSGYANSARQLPQDGRRLPGGFFDVQENAKAGTTNGAQPGNAAPLTPKFAPGVTAQQAFFSGNDIPPLPTQTEQPISAFQDFYQDPTPPGGGQFPEAGQQPGPGQSQRPGTPRLPGQAPQGQFQQGQPQHPAPYEQPGTNQQPTQFNWPRENNQPAVQYPETAQPDENPLLSQSSGSTQTGSNIPRGTLNRELPPSTTPGSSPTGKKRKRRPRIVEEEPVTDYTASAVEMDNFKRFEKLVVSPETKGLTMLAFHEARQVLTQPEEFFKTMPTRGNIAEPAIFLFIVAAVSGLLAGIINTNLVITLQFMIGNILQAVMLSFICWKMYTGMGSTEPFETTFRVIAYSQATLIIAGLKFSLLGNWIPAYITLLIATIFAIRLQVIGMKQVHDMPTGKVMPVLILTTLFILLIRSRSFLL